MKRCAPNEGSRIHVCRFTKPRIVGGVAVKQCDVTVVGVGTATYSTYGHDFRMEAFVGRWPCGWYA